MKVINQKKRRISKRNKIAWRKHVDITDVEDYLDDQRLEQILGPACEKTNDELFRIDTTPSKISLSTKQRRKLKILEPAKCYSALDSVSKIVDPVGKRSSRRLKEQRQEKMIVSSVIKERKHEKVTKRRLLERSVASKSKEIDGNYDLWEADLSLFGNNGGSVDVRNDSWVSGDAERHLMHGQGKRSKIVPKTVGKKPLGANSIELPHPGMSYNPSFKDHQDLLRTIALKEQEVIKQQQHVNRVTKHMFRKISPDEKYNDWLQEMSQGLPSLDPTVEAPAAGVFDSKVSVNPPTVNKKKTLKQRKRHKVEQQKQLQRKSRKLEKRKITAILRLKHLETHIKKLDVKSVVKQSKKATKLEAAKKCVKRVGRMKFEEPALEFNRAQDISGNLRTIRKEGNLLADRWNSLQKRNLIEVTAIGNKKKGKVKKFVRAGHKEDWKEMVAKPNNSWDRSRRLSTVNKGRNNRRNN